MTKAPPPLPSKRSFQRKGWGMVGLATVPVIALISWIVISRVYYYFPLVGMSARSVAGTYVYEGQGMRETIELRENGEYNQELHLGERVYWAKGEFSCEESKGLMFMGGLYLRPKVGPPFPAEGPELEQRAMLTWNPMEQLLYNFPNEKYELKKISK